MQIDAASLSFVSADAMASAVAMRVLKKGMDIAKEQGDAAVALIRAAAKTAPGANALESSGRIDVTV